MPPTSCTSKCRMLSTRRPASRTTAKASGSSPSRVSPLESRCRNSSVLARRASSERARVPGSSSPIAWMVGRMRFSSRSFLVPMTFVRMVFSISWIRWTPPLRLIRTGYQAPCGGVKPGTERARRGARREERLAEGLVLVEDVLDGVLGLVVEPHLVVEVGGRALARVAHEGDHVPAPHPLAGLHVEAREVGVAGHEPVAVVDDHGVPVAALLA